MKTQANSKRKDCNFKQGDLVLLRLRPYRQLSVARRSSQKLAPRFYGPYRVLEQIGAVAFRLELPPDSRIHPVFHASLLRPYHPPTTYKVHHLPSADSPLPPSHVPLAIISERTIVRHGHPVPQVLIQWSDLPPDDATWEDKSFVFLTPQPSDTPSSEMTHPSPDPATPHTKPPKADPFTHNLPGETRQRVEIEVTEAQTDAGLFTDTTENRLGDEGETGKAGEDIVGRTGSEKTELVDGGQRNFGGNENRLPYFRRDSLVVSESIDCDSDTSPTAIMIPHLPTRLSPTATPANRVPLPGFPSNEILPAGSHLIPSSSASDIEQTTPFGHTGLTRSLSANLEDKVYLDGPTIVADPESVRPRRITRVPKHLRDYVL